MNPTDIFKREVFRPVLTLVVPGTVATAPYLLWACHHSTPLLTFLKAHPAVAILPILVLATAVGVILDDCGTRLESKVWDKRLDKKQRGQHLAEWNAYLQLDRSESIAEGYLSTVVLKLKFELGLGFGLLFGWPGMLFYRHAAGVWSGWGFWLATLILVGVVVFLFKESYDSAEVLGKIRHLILESRDKLPPSSQAETASPLDDGMSHQAPRLLAIVFFVLGLAIVLLLAAVLAIAGVTLGQGLLCAVSDFGAGVVGGDLTQASGDVRSEERPSGLACVAEQRMHCMPPNAGHGVFEDAEDMWNGPRVRVLVQEFEAATANHRILM